MTNDLKRKLEVDQPDSTTAASKKTKGSDRQKPAKRRTNKRASNPNRLPKGLEAQIVDALVTSLSTPTPPPDHLHHAYTQLVPLLSDSDSSQGLDYAGRSIHNVLVATTLHSLLAISPLVQDWDKEKKHSLFEVLCRAHSTPRAACVVSVQISHQPMPATNAAREQELVLFYRFLWWSNRTDDRNLLPQFYMELLSQTLEMTIPIFDADWLSSQNGAYMAKAAHESSCDLRSASGGKEDALVEALRPVSNHLARLLAPLKRTGEDLDEEVTNNDPAVDGYRSLELKGRLLLRGGMANQYARLYPMRTLVGNANCNKIQDITRLAGSKGVVTFCAKLAGLNAVSDARLSGKFFAILAKLWEQSPREYDKVTRRVFSCLLYFSNEVVFSGKN